tara:strand:+ start:855 stop:1274 length:420 start_codon:yes stop_codon:yes gene_type:complete
MTYAIGDIVEGPGPCAECGDEVYWMFAAGRNYAGRIMWRCRSCFESASLEQAADVDEKPKAVVESVHSQISPPMVEQVGGRNMATEKAAITITMIRGKAVKNGYRYDSKSEQVKGSLYLDAETSKGVTALAVTLVPTKA